MQSETEISHSEVHAIETTGEWNEIMVVLNYSYVPDARVSDETIPGGDDPEVQGALSFRPLPSMFRVEQVVTRDTVLISLHAKIVMQIVATPSEPVPTVGGTVELTIASPLRICHRDGDPRFMTVGRASMVTAYDNPVTPGAVYIDSSDDERLHLRLASQLAPPNTAGTGQFSLDASYLCWAF